MRTSGNQGSEGTLILTAAIVLLGVGVVIAGGPRDFFALVDSVLRDTAEELMRWVHLRL
jgi:hypothetical protein